MTIAFFSTVLTPFELYVIAGAFGFGCGFLSGVLGMLWALRK